MVLGHMDESIQNWESVLGADKVPVEELLDVARMQVQRQLLAPKPDWDRVERALKCAEQASENNQRQWVDVQLLRAEMAAAQVNYDRADQISSAALERYPKDGELWTARAFLKFKEKPQEPALRWSCWTRCARRSGADRVELRLARAYRGQGPDQGRGQISARPQGRH